MTITVTKEKLFELFQQFEDTLDTEIDDWTTSDQNAWRDLSSRFTIWLENYHPDFRAEIKGKVFVDKSGRELTVISVGSHKYIAFDAKTNHGPQLDALTYQEMIKWLVNFGFVIKN